jgi:microcin C transport system substrate-binding protein
VIDELVERIITAQDRAELVALTRALDRILLVNWYTIPMWHNPELWFAWWKKLVSPPMQPAYTGVDIYSWWIDGAAQNATGAAN